MLDNRDSPEGRLLAHIPESIRETCEAEYTSFPNGVHYVAVEGHPEAIAGFFCHWKGTLPGPEDNISLTYLLFDSKAWMDANYRKLGLTPNALHVVAQARKARRAVPGDR